MAAVRVIACLDIFDGKVVKGVKFGQHKEVGDPLELARKYSEEGIDELVFYDIGASPKNKLFDRKLIEKIAKAINIPFCVAGGIRSVDDALIAISSGADKISINSSAVQRPELISEISRVLGSQAVVVGIDVKNEQIFRLTGMDSTSQKTDLDLLSWCEKVEALGCGEIVLNCMESDGTNSGANIELLRKVQSRVSVPLIASGGLGSPLHFKEVITEAKVSGALGASIFHYGHYSVKQIKNYLCQEGIEVRT